MDPRTEEQSSWESTGLQTDKLDEMPAERQVSTSPDDNYSFDSLQALSPPFSGAENFSESQTRFEAERMNHS